MRKVQLVALLMGMLLAMSDREIAENVMRMRQAGVPIHEAMDYVRSLPRKKREEAREMTYKAYKVPKYKTEAFKKMAIKEFGRKYRKR